MKCSGENVIVSGIFTFPVMPRKVGLLYNSVGSKYPKCCLWSISQTRKQELQLTKIHYFKEMWSGCTCKCTLCSLANKKTFPEEKDEQRKLAPKTDGHRAKRWRLTWYRGAEQTQCLLLERYSYWLFVMIIRLWFEIWYEILPYQFFNVREVCIYKLMYKNWPFKNLPNNFCVG